MCFEANLGKLFFRSTIKTSNASWLQLGFFLFFYFLASIYNFFSHYIKHTSNISKFSLILLRKNLSNIYKNKYRKVCLLKRKKEITFSKLECPIFRILMTVRQSDPLICSIMELNLADIHFQCSNSVNGPELSASFLICWLSIRTCNQIGKRKEKAVLENRQIV